MAGLHWLKPGDTAVDFSFQPPAMSAARAAGYSAIIGYLPWDPNRVESGCLNHGIIDACYDAGMAWASVWELNADRALGGWAAGTTDGHSAVYAHAGLGGAPGSLISCAIDFDANPNTQPAVLDYAAGFSEVVRATGFAPATYGGIRSIDAVMASSRTQYAWQTEAWSYGAETPYAHILQRANFKLIASTDHNNIYKPVPFTGAEGISSIMAFSDDPAQQSFTDKVIIGLLTAPHPQMLRDGQPSAPALADIYEAVLQAGRVREQVEELAVAQASTDAVVRQIAARVDQLASAIAQIPAGGGSSATAADLVRELIGQLGGVKLPAVRLGAPRPVDNTGDRSDADLEREAIEAISYGPKPPSRPLSFGPSYPFSGSPHRPFTPA